MKGKKPKTWGSATPIAASTWTGIERLHEKKRVELQRQREQGTLARGGRR